ncbi:DUF6259 domain-containing protein [Clostridium swellfunianum]|uniref:DUF6259 domain-containing protein n=1 Tax=Clostridium swellfunianum TaxID=1367462 RepID=UPI00202EED46|nr:DUF6259 domain-containing protein [Clostridium swellfunianum]MCM0650077.1 DUF6259 domain-containing protein [Clostridium swellfunianum]
MKYKKAVFAGLVCLALIVSGTVIFTNINKSKGKGDDNLITVENKQIAISFSKSKGNIVSFYDKSKKLEYVDENKSSDPFRLDWSFELDSKFESFTYEKDKEVKNGTGYILKWQVNPAVQVIGKIQLLKDSNEVSFYSEVVNNSEKGIAAIEYPVISNLKNISSKGENDYLAHSFATGVLIHSPMKNFKFGGDGLRFMPYPEGFSGSTMQYFTYYGEGYGGLYFAAYDGEFYQKWLNFAKNKNDLLEASFMHGYEDIGPRKGIKVNYPVVIKTMQEGSWYEASDIYRQWAEKQKWSQKGKLTKMDDSNKAKWLLEDMGLSTFGINGMHDRSEWINRYHDLVQTNVFHVLGPDWPKSRQNYYNGVPGGFNDWYPARFNANNINTINKIGDKYAPFEFDYLINTAGADSEKVKKSLQLMPVNIRSNDQYKFSLICPVADFTKNLHVKRDEYLQKEYNVDSIYYDISANNILKTCMDPTHGHKVGGGKEITEAYRENYINTKEAMIKAAGKYIPMGTEMINEVFLDVLDYYQARAGAQPGTAFEGYNLRDLIKSGEAELIPMFTYVYHEYGPVRLDGWGKLTEEAGDLFYFTAARTYLWGGLYELNEEYGPMEALNGKENSPEEHYYAFKPAGYELAPERGEYLRQFASLRTGKGNKYLAYGKMLKPVEAKGYEIELNWYNYFVPKSGGEYNEKGKIKLDSIISSAWMYENKSLGLFYSNVQDKEQKITLPIDMRKYNLEGKDFSISLIKDGSDTSLGTISKNETKELELTIPARKVIMIEIK